MLSSAVTINGKMQTAVAASGETSGANPHAGLKVAEVPTVGMAKPASASSAKPHGSQGADAGPVHKGKVVSTMNAAGYTYVEVEEKGTKLWAAVTETKVKPGDTVEFPDVPPMKNFHSNSLNRTFETIIFSPTIRINGKS